MTDFLVLGIAPGTNYKIDINSIVLVWALFITVYKGRRQLFGIFGHNKANKYQQEYIDTVSI